MQPENHKRLESKKRQIETEGSWLKAIILFIAVIQVVSVVVLVGFATKAVIDGRERSHDLCVAQVENRTALRTVLFKARDETIASVDTEEQRLRIRKFYDRVLAEVPPIHCEL